MELHPLGDTNLQVSRLGLGLAALGRPGYINLGRVADLGDRRSPDELRRRSHRVLDSAWAAGIRYLDTARSYGRAEEFLGTWLVARSVSPAEVTIGSKWGYRYTADWRVDAEVHEVKEHTLPVFRQQWEESRAELGDHLDLYQIHSATLESGVLEDRSILSALVELRDRRGTRIGLTLSGSGQSEALRRALELEVESRRVFDTVQATWNLLEPSVGAALDEASRAGLGVIVKEALANGRLTGRDNSGNAWFVNETLAKEAARLGVTPDALSLSAALRQPWADVVLSGATSTAQLSSNIAALDVAWDESTEENLAVLAEPADAYWAHRSDLAWR